MTKEWTSLSVTESQKGVIESHKPEGMSMGAFLVDAIESNNDSAKVDESAIATMVVEDLRASLPREIAEELGR